MINEFFSFAEKKWLVLKIFRFFCVLGEFTDFKICDVIMDITAK